MDASPGYFSVFKIPIVRGRDFTFEDDGTAPGVVIINEAFAEKYWPKQNPIDQQILTRRSRNQNLAFSRKLEPLKKCRNPA